MEAHDYDLIKQEEKQKEWNEQYQEDLSNIKIDFENILSEANLMQITDEDLLDCIVEAVGHVCDLNIKIERN